LVYKGTCTKVGSHGRLYNLATKAKYRKHYFCRRWRMDMMVDTEESTLYSIVSFKECSCEVIT
jgi:hypothetical protein